MRQNPDIRLRGLLLEILAENRGLEIPFEFGMLSKTLQTMGRAITDYRLRALLEYLAAKECVEVKRVSDLPGKPAGDEAADHIMLVKLTPKGLDVVDHVVAVEGITVT